MRMLSLVTRTPRPSLMIKKKKYSNEFLESELNNIFPLVCFLTVRFEYISLYLLVFHLYNKYGINNTIFRKHKETKVIEKSKLKS